MKRKLFFTLVLILVLSLFSATIAFAQVVDQDDEVADQVRVKIMKRSDESVFLILSTIGLPVEDESGGLSGFTTDLEDIIEGRITTQIRRLAAEVGTESGRERFYGLSVDANTDETFTVERGVYFSRSFSCGDDAGGVTDVRSQLRLVFVPCQYRELPNPGEPTMEKVLLEEGQDRIHWRYHYQ
jgi:hypothetical protein